MRMLAPLLPTLGSSPGYGSVACSPAAPQPARYRAVAEAVLVRALDSRLGAAERHGAPLGAGGRLEGDRRGRQSGTRAR